MEDKIKHIIEEIGIRRQPIIKRFYLGKNKLVKAALVYIKEISDKDIIDRDILTPLMLYVDEEVFPHENISSELCEKYLPMSNTYIEQDINKAISMIKDGFSIIVIENTENIIVADTIGGEYRSISEPQNETSMRSSREGFVEKIESNIGLVKRMVSGKNLAIEYSKIGIDAERDLALIYMDNVVNREALEEIKRRLSLIEAEVINDTGILCQYLEDNTYTPFPQIYSTERPDTAISKILEGKIMIMLNGNASVLTVPTGFIEFFRTIDDYSERTILASFTRILRVLATLTVLILSPIYLTLLKFNTELIPTKFMSPIIQSRVGIALTPFLEILVMEIVVEFLREGGLRLPPKIANTVSIVGGIIIGDMAVQSKVVSPTTLLVIGISVIATFLIPNYQMSMCIRFLRFPLLIVANSLGFIGIAAGIYLLTLHLASLNSFGSPYFTTEHDNIKDFFIRDSLWKNAASEGKLQEKDSFGKRVRRNESGK